MRSRPLLLAAFLMTMTGCGPTGHRPLTRVFPDEMARFGYDNCQLDAVTVVDYHNAKCFCVASRLDNVFNDADSVIVRKLTLKNKRTLFDFIYKDSAAARQVTLSGWQSSRPAIIDGYAVVYSLVPVNATRQK